MNNNLENIGWKNIKYTGIATVLSAIYPGLGQFYNGELLKGFACSICGSILIYGIWFFYNAALTPTYFLYEPSYDFSMFIALIYVSVWMYSIFDANSNAKLE